MFSRAPGFPFFPNFYPDREGVFMQYIGSMQLLANQYFFVGAEIGGSGEVQSVWVTRPPQTSGQTHVQDEVGHQDGEGVCQQSTDVSGMYHEHYHLPRAFQGSVQLERQALNDSVFVLAK